MKKELGEVQKSLEDAMLRLMDLDNLCRKTDELKDKAEKQET